MWEYLAYIGNRYYGPNGQQRDIQTATMHQPYGCMHGRMDVCMEGSSHSDNKWVSARLYEYHSYQAASLALSANNDPVAATVGEAFSQKNMALASEVFDVDNNIRQRLRGTVSVTRIPEAPSFYPAVVCLVCSAFGTVTNGSGSASEEEPGDSGPPAEACGRMWPGATWDRPRWKDKEVENDREDEDLSSRRSSGRLSDLSCHSLAVSRWVSVFGHPISMLFALRGHAGPAFRLCVIIREAVSDG